MEAGKERLTRDVTRTEMQEIKRENTRLKQLVAELSLQVHILKKQWHQTSNKGEVCSDECQRKEGDFSAGFSFRLATSPGFGIEV
jgi:hypothetical protein